MVNPVSQYVSVILNQVLLMLILVVAGVVAYKTHVVTKEGSKHLSNLLVLVVSPVVIFVSYQRDFDVEMLKGLGEAFGLSLLGFGIAMLVAYLCLRKNGRYDAVIERFSVIYSNCGFMGYPLMMAMLGSIGVFYGSAYVVVFTVLSWTVGIYMITHDVGKLRLKAVLLNPGVISVVAAMALYLLSVRLPELVMTPLNYLANMNTPLPMIVVGYQLSHANFRQAFSDRRSWGALGLRLVVIPLAAIALCYLLRVDSAVAMVTVIAASTPPAALMSMFAQKFGADTKLASSVVSVFTAISVLTIPPMVGLAQYLMG